jgi:hypothetical protein
LQSFANFTPGYQSHDLIHNISVFDNQEGRQGLNPEKSRHTRIGLHVEGGDLRSSTELYGDLLDHWRQGAAGTAPRRPDIDEDRFFAAEYLR